MNNLHSLQLQHHLAVFAHAMPKAGTQEELDQQEKDANQEDDRPVVFQ